MLFKLLFGDNMKKNLGIDDYVLITPDEAIEEYEISNELLEDIDSEESMRYYDGNLVVNGDFVLDFDNDECSGILIKGDLIVDGNIIDQTSSDVIFNVKGKTTAKNVILENTISHFEKGLIVENIIIMDSSNSTGYNHGAFQNSGTSVYTKIKAKAVIKYRFSSYMDSEKLDAILIDVVFDKEDNNDEYYSSLVKYGKNNLKEIISEHFFDDDELETEELKEAVLSNQNIFKQ